MTQRGTWTVVVASGLAPEALERVGAQTTAAAGSSDDPEGLWVLVADRVSAAARASLARGLGAELVERLILVDPRGARAFLERAETLYLASPRSTDLEALGPGAPGLVVRRLEDGQRLGAEDAGLGPAKRLGRIAALRCRLAAGVGGARRRLPRNPTLSVLVVQWERQELTRRALESVRRSSGSREWEILVWDNGSSGGAQLPPGPWRVVGSDRNIGFGPANNALLAMARAQRVLFLNNDVVLEPDCIATLLATHVETGAALVAPLLRGFDGSVQELGSHLDPSGYSLGLFRGRERVPGYLSQPFETEYASAACLLGSRSLLTELGGFDDVYAPAYYEDADLCLRLREAGGRVVVEPAATAFHVEAATSSSSHADRAGAGRDLLLRNRSRFRSRWAEHLGRLGPLDPARLVLRTLGGSKGDSLVLIVAESRAVATRLGVERGRKGLRAVLWAPSNGTSARGRAWVEGYPEPIAPDPQRWPEVALVDLLEEDAWDVVVLGAGAESRFGGLVRRSAPSAELVVAE